jgi:hypothetical protein
MSRWGRVVDLVTAAVLAVGMPDTEIPVPVAAPTPTPASDRDTLPPKKELVVWTRITPQQLELYRAFLATDRVSQVRPSPRPTVRDPYSCMCMWV